MEHTWHAPKQGEIYKFQCSNNTQFMGTSKFTYGAHKACPQKRKIYKLQCSNITQFMATSKFSRVTPKRKNILIPMF